MKQHVFVAGVDYEFQGTSFRRYCDSRINLIVKRSTREEELNFIVFDIGRGSHEVVNVSFALGRSKRTTRVVAAYKPVSSKSQFVPPSVGLEWTFKPKQDGTLSITHVYESIRGIGEMNQGSLAEVSIFSHAWFGGPVLVNSSDLYGSENASGQRIVLRDPDDKDPRADKDFVAPTNNAASLTAMRKAFASKGTIRLWGCLFYQVGHSILLKLERAAAFHESGTKDSQVLDLTLLRSEVDAINRVIIPKTGRVPENGKARILFGDIREFFYRLTQATYAFRIADAMGAPTCAALVGTGAEPMRDRNGGETMGISAAKWGRHLAFYRNYLGIKPDPEGYNYGVYVKDMPIPPSA